ncbi:MAG: RecB family exonuclease [Acidimicrobiales bacterium]
MRRKTLSPSTAQAMRGCSARWVIEHLLPRSADPFGAPELGTAAHRVFEILFSLPPEERTHQQGSDIVHSLHLDGLTEPSGVVAPTNPDDLSVWHSEIMARVNPLWNMEDPCKVEVLGLEVPLTDVDVGGIPFGGFADRVILRDGHVVIGDYKAGLSKPKKPSDRFGDHHGDQARLYAVALDGKCLYDPVEEAEILYTPHRVTRSVDLSKSAIAKTVADFQISYEALTKQTASGQFTTKTSALCGWCPAVAVCPTAISNGKVPRIEFPVPGEALGIGIDGPMSVGKNKVPPSKDVPEIPTPKKEVIIMSKDVVPYEETLRDGSLNPGSYAATAVFGTVELAVKELHRADMPIKGSSVTALARTFAHIVGTVYQEIDGSDPSFQHGLHKNLRGALYTSIVTLPIPFGGGPDEWESWVLQTTTRVRSIAKAAFALWECEDLGDEPWRVLAEAPTLSVVS